MTDNRQDASQAQGEVWTHVKRGTSYEVLGRAELQNGNVKGLREGVTLVVYRGDDGKLWAREEGEFTDGRFVRVSAPGATAQDGVERDNSSDLSHIRGDLKLATPTPTIPAGMVAGPRSGDLAAALINLRGHAHDVIEQNGRNKVAVALARSVLAATDKGAGR